MITSQLESLNRKNRILARLLLGDTHRAIANDEGICRSQVSKIGVKAGIRVPIEKRIQQLKETVALRHYPAVAAFREISRRLDEYNARVGRTRKVKAA